MEKIPFKSEIGRILGGDHMYKNRHIIYRIRGMAIDS